MCLSGRGLVVGIYVPFRKGVVGRQLFALVVRGRGYALMCPSGRGLVVICYVPFR
jgi:hypothetical protein